jgi:hypothetical protein
LRDSWPAALHPVIRDGYGYVESTPFGFGLKGTFSPRVDQNLRTLIVS